MSKKSKNNGMTRREYLKTSFLGATGLFMAPTVVPSKVIGKRAPSNNINIAQIGWGRIATGHDLPGVLSDPGTRLIAACDVDLNRVNGANEWAKNFYNSENVQRPDDYVEVNIYQNYREMLEEEPDIDAVIISTPDHAHVMPTIEAALAGKHIYLQKPHSLTVEEGRLMTNIVQRMGTVFQIGSQQRASNPWPHFKRACELVRNGRVGNLQTIEIGLPYDPPGGNPAPQPVPDGLDYDAWLGTTPQVPYTEDRVHSKEGIVGRPGWLRCENYSAGMITGWGAHHLDIAHWGMGTEYSGPIELEANAVFPTDDPNYDGLWDVHGDFRVEAKYKNGVTMIVSDPEVYSNGIRFIGDEGWIFVTRSGGVTEDDPDSDTEVNRPLQASNANLLSELGSDAFRLYGYGSPDETHHHNWLRCIREQTTATAAPAEVSHRSTSACLISHIAMKLPRKLYWDPINERFKDDDEANAMLSRPQRYPYKISQIPGLVTE